jgi:hypothetical protein
LLSEDKLRQARERVAELGTLVFDLLPGIREQPRAATLTSHELLVLALLFHRRISGMADAFQGAALIGLLLRAGVPRSEALQLLDGKSELREQNWISAEIPRGGLDPLDGFFLPTPTALALFWPRLAPPEPSAEESAEDSAKMPKCRPFSSELEYLWEIFGWRQACLKRATVLFDQDHEKPSRPQVQEMRDTARGRWVNLRQRLAMTQGSREYGLEKLAADFRLGPDHTLVVAHLLFAETLDAEIYLSPSECLRLIADRRESVFTQRAMFGPKGRLRREGIVLAEAEDSAKMLAVPLSLADWVAERVLAGLGQSPKWSQQELEDFLRGESGR